MLLNAGARPYQYNYLGIRPVDVDPILANLVPKVPQNHYICVKIGPKYQIAKLNPELTATDIVCDTLKEALKLQPFQIFNIDSEPKGYARFKDCWLRFFFI